MSAMKRIFMLAIVSFILSCCGTTAHRIEPTPGAPVPLVTFIFDDGDDTDYLVGKKIFEQQGAIACSAITTGWINTEDHLTTAQIKELSDAGWEIMSHTVTHPNLRSLTPEEVDAELAKSKNVLESMGLTVKNLVYPYNRSNESVRAIASKYYRSARGGANTMNSGVIDPYYLKSFSMKHDLARMKERIDEAYANKAWVIFYQHEVDIQVKISDKHGTFLKGETLTLSPSGTTARYVTVHWFPIYGFSLYLVPFSGVPHEGDRITGTKSGATARIDSLIYDDLALLTEMIHYAHATYPDMRIVTIDQGLDLLGLP